MQARARLDFSGKTTTDILELWQDRDLPLELKEKMSQWLMLADKEKYAPAKGEPGDILRLTTEIKNFMKKINGSNRAEAR